MSRVGEKKTNSGEFLLMGLINLKLIRPTGNEENDTSLTMQYRLILKSCLFPLYVEHRLGEVFSWVGTLGYMSSI